MTLSATNERFDAWLASGGDRGKLWEYMTFISGAKRYALKHDMGVRTIMARYYSDPPIVVWDHDAFDEACWAYAAGISEGAR